ncbi:MAG TPA: M57 family metalloprotease [Thermoanaerobaculia bacterium]|nr:M57 family metalloprotease [Thermoanaerobaculia bacterium]
MKRFRPWCLALLLVAAAANASAAVFVVPDDDDLIDDADAIVIASIDDFHGQFLWGGDIETVFRLRIHEVLKGDLSAGELQMHETGGEVGRFLMATSDAPVYWKNNRALIFLQKTPDGQWRTYGAALGKFDFVHDNANRNLAVRWATSKDDELWTQDGHPYEEKLRSSEAFIRYIRRRIYLGERGAHLRIATDDAHATKDYFVAPVANETLTAPYGWTPETDATYPPSAYTQGNFRWEDFDNGGSVTFTVSGSQPGYDSIGAAQRALAAWTNDAGSNVDYRYGGTRTATFVEDGINSIVYNSATDVPAGALAYSKWYANATHTYKGETFYSIAEGDVVVKSNISVSQKVFEEAVTHELGHTLGFRHSDQGTPSSTEAVMKAVLTGNYGATLGPWDVEAVRTVYTSGTTQTPPPTTLLAPANLVATASTTTSVTITWGAVSGATSYILERSTNNVNWTPIATTSSTAFVDNGRSPGVTYLYRVRATNGTVNSLYSNIDHATTILFTDDPLVAGQTEIKAVHLTQLRQAVNAVRIATGLAAVTWTDPNPTGVTVKAIHIIELRNALTAALVRIGKTATFTDPTLTAGSTVKAVHIQQLRNYTK